MFALKQFFSTFLAKRGKDSCGYVTSFVCCYFLNYQNYACLVCCSHQLTLKVQFCAKASFSLLLIPLDQDGALLSDLTGQEC